MIVKFLKNLPFAIAGTRHLVHRYKTSRVFAAFETFAILKTLTDTGKIHKGKVAWYKFKEDLSEACLVSKNTMDNRIQWMKDFDLITIDANGNLLLESWDDLAIRYHIQNKEFYEIEVTKETPALCYKLKTLVIAELKSRLIFRFSQFINNNRVKAMLEAKLPIKNMSVQAIADYILTCQFHTFKARTEHYDFWHSFAADFNCNITTLKGYFGFDSEQNVSYLKRVLSKLKLIFVEERSVESILTTRAPKNIFTGETIKRHMNWNDATNTRFMRYPDSITINSPAL